MVQKEENGSVLLLEDDSAQLRAGRELLKRAGYRTYSACNALQGLDIIRSGRQIDVVVADHRMPGLTGLELAEVLHTQSIKIPVVLVSSDLTEQIMGRGIEVGVKGFIDKPYRDHHFLGIVRTILGENKKPVRFADHDCGGNDKGLLAPGDGEEDTWENGYLR